MVYTVTYGKQFAIEFQNYPEEQKDKILDFTDIFEKYGLEDFNQYEGKISQSWSGLGVTTENFNRATEHDLWHYHIGLPEYQQVHGKYKTSDIVLHFQWPDRGSAVNLVDVYSHYTSDGEFYLPSDTYLK